MDSLIRFAVRAVPRAVALAALLGTTTALAQGPTLPGPATPLPAPDSSDPYSLLPRSIALNAVVRDFRGSSETNGHPDFEAFIGSGATIGLVENRLDLDRKPVLRSTTGKPGSMFNNRIDPNRLHSINPALFDPARGDLPPTWGSTVTMLTGSAAFAQWYRDVPGVNASTTVQLVLTRVPGTDRYVVDTDSDLPWSQLGGFFPINSGLFGPTTFLSGGAQNPTNVNYHFTTEITARFVYRRTQNQVFTFAGDDDVWVFIDGTLAIDLGGTHGRVEQSIDLDRLGLTDNREYEIKIFHAERHANESNLRIETNLQLRTIETPMVTDLHD